MAKISIDDLPFSFSQRRILEQMDTDLRIWGEGTLAEIFPFELAEKYSGKTLAKKSFAVTVRRFEDIKNSPKSYEGAPEYSYDRKIEFTEVRREKLPLGFCPVASEATRCCNLLTLDAVESCGFDCSYCSIQSFYNQNRIGFDPDFAARLRELKLDPDTVYHIGTGQSSDSLMWGNRGGVLEALLDFARRNPNVILELKTKSDNISWLLKNPPPSNVLITWSLNPQRIIEHEEHLSASLERRLEAARAVADTGAIVGFHFHPIVVYENYLQEYKSIYQYLIDNFDPKDVVMVSLGTLTFIKPVIQQLRDRNFKTKILQMPTEDINGKQSYPIEQKREMFKFAYDSLKSWHDKVYFYLCMEPHSLWKDVFGYEYCSNNQFEDFMKDFYYQKISNK
jgi:spore photoproduct lyase